VRLRRRARRRFGAEERDIERVQLRPGQVGELRAADPVQEVDQRGEREPRLGAAPACRQDAKAATPSRVDTGPPDRRLPDPGLAAEHERAWRSARVQECLEGRELRFAADDPRTRVGCLPHHPATG